MQVAGFFRRFCLEYCTSIPINFSIALVEDIVTIAFLFQIIKLKVKNKKAATAIRIAIVIAVIYFSVCYFKTYFPEMFKL